MLREMKLFLYFLAFLLCLGAKISNADSGKNIESKRKFISISNKAKDDAAIQCKSDKQNFNKTLKPGEKVRWGLPEKAARTAICHVALGSGGAHGYLSAFLEKQCKRECKWRVLDGGALNLKVGDEEWKSFELQPDEEAARDSGEHQSCDEDEDDNDDDDQLNHDNGKWKSPAPAPETKSRAHGARLAPSTSEGKTGHGNSPKWKSPAPAPKNGKTNPREPRRTKRGKKEPAPAPLNNAKTAAPQTKHEPENFPNWQSPAPATMSEKAKSRARGAKSAPPPTKRIRKAPAPGKWKPKNAKPAPPPMKHDQGKLRSINSRSPSPAPPVSTKPRAPPPAKQIKKAQPPTEQGRRKLKPRNRRSPVPVKAPATDNGKTESGAHAAKAAPPPSKQIKKARENAKIAPPPMEHGQGKSRSRNSPAAAPYASPKSRAPSPAKQIKKAKPPTKQGRRKLKPRNPRSPLPPVKAPAPEGKKTESVEQIKRAPEIAKTAPPPTKRDHRKSRHGNFPKWKAPAPADWKTKPAPPPTKHMDGDVESPPTENRKRTPRAPSARPAPPPRKLKPVSAPPPPPAEGGEESERPDAEQPPLPRPGSTFYSCIKEDSR